MSFLEKELREIVAELIAKYPDPNAAAIAVLCELEDMSVTNLDGNGWVDEDPIMEVALSEGVDEAIALSLRQRSHL